MIAELDRVAREVAAVRPEERPRLWGLYRALGAVAPASVPALVRAVADLAPGPLDAGLHVLLDAWRGHDEPQLLGWLGDLQQHRPAVPVAGARALDTYAWCEAGHAYVALYEQGVADPRPEVRDEFWSASGALLAADPGTVSQRMVAAAASPLACGASLGRACEHDGRAWGEGLTARDAAPVLHLIDRAGWEGWTSQQVVTGIATGHPLVVLEHLAQADSTSTLPDGDVDRLAGVLDGHGEVLARWLVDRATSPAPPVRDAVVALVLADGLGTTTAAALERLVVGLDGEALARLLAMLEPSGGASALSTWPQQRPGLARAVLRRARTLGARSVESATVRLESAMRVWSWSSDGVSDELRQALEVTTTRAEDEPDEELRALYENARERIAAQSRDEERWYEADE